MGNCANLGAQRHAYDQGLFSQATGHFGASLNLLIAVLLTIAVPASARVDASGSVDTPAQSWTATKLPTIELVLPKFDDRGGTRALKSIEFLGDVTAETRIEFENRSSQTIVPTRVTFTQTGSLDLAIPGDGSIFQSGTFATSDQSFNLPGPLCPNDGVPFSGCDYFDSGVRSFAFSVSGIGCPIGLPGGVCPPTLAFFIDSNPAAGSQDTFVAVVSVDSEFNINVSPNFPNATQDFGFLTSGALRVRYSFVELGACCLPGGTCELRTAQGCAAGGGSYAGDGVTCDQAACQACCLSNGTCNFEPLAACQARTGAFPQGSGVTCATALCEWACCLPNGTCVNTTQANCTSQSGTYTSGSRCEQLAPDFCARACCLPNGTCVNTTQANCTAQNGTYTAASRCEQLAPDFCARACCLPNGTCVNTSQVSCTSQGGSFTAGSRCEQLAPDFCLRACCLPNGTCVNTTQANCGTLGGSYNSGSRCEQLAPDTCLWACCLSTGECIDTTQADCSSRGGAYNALQKCASVPCPSFACCLPNGTCVNLTQAACASQNGTFTAGVDCAALPATACNRACCLPNGTCVNTTQANCTSQNGTYTPGSRCEQLPVGTCLRACCLPDGTCTDTTEVDCTQRGGSYNSASQCAQLASGTCLRACCLPDGTCVNTTLADCTQRSGTYNSASQCAQLPAGTCFRACCLPNGTCLNTTAADCTSQGGTYNSASRCEQLAPDFCARACCLPAGTCVNTTLAGCSSQGGVFNAAGRCEGLPAGACLWACCLSDGSCTEVTQAQCVTLSGSYSPLQRCSQVSCTRGCCLPNGTCIDTTLGACTTAGGSFSATSTCAQLPADFCARSCCLPGGFCVNTTQADCSQRGGTYNGQLACGSPSQECPRACCLPSGQCQELTPSQCALAFGSIQTLGSTCQTVVCDNPCLCYWLNGEADGRNAVVSESNVLVPRSDSADDIIVPAGNVLFGREFCGIMVTNDLYRRVGWIIDKPNALLNIYSDCNGKPGDLLAMFTTPTYEVLGNAPFGSPGQWKYVKFCFDIASLRLDASEREQRFWVSLVGVGENDPGDRYFWATSKTEPTTSVQGVQAQLRSDWVVGFEDWRDIEDTNAVCHDLAFDLCGDLVGVIGDTSPLALDCGVKMLNTTSFRTKVADNFQVQPCAFAEIREVTLWVATNLAPTAATLEVYGDGCDQPELIVPQAGTLSTREVRSNGAPVVFVSPVSSQPLPVYELTWSFPPGVFGLEGGRNFWLASFLESGGESTAEAFALCRPSTSCDIVITQARFLTAPFGVNDWTAVSSVLGAERDLAYRVLGVVRPAELPSYLASPQRDPDPVAVPAKMSDLNGDGVVDVEDVREMLRRIGAAGSSDSAGR